jgi:replicative superfamily II helicase
MVDSLNAEISLGTVANTRDGVRWLGYTYLFVRMRKNPFIYGLFISINNGSHLFSFYGQGFPEMRQTTTLSWETRGTI